MKVQVNNKEVELTTGNTIRLWPCNWNYRRKV